MFGHWPTVLDLQRFRTVPLNITREYNGRWIWSPIPNMDVEWSIKGRNSVDMERL